MSFNFMAAVNICSDFGAPKIKSLTVSTVSPYICYEVMGPDAMILVVFFFFNFNTGHLQTWRTHLSESCLFVLLYSL